jgi:hypothetical protein
MNVVVMPMKPVLLSAWAMMWQWNAHTPKGVNAVCFRLSSF